MTKELIKSGARELDFTPKTKEEMLKEASNLVFEQEIDKSDIVIPQLIVMQSNAQLVKAGAAKYKDILDVSTKEVVGNESKRLEIIPIMYSKSLRIDKCTNAKAQTFEYDQRLYNVNETTIFEWKQKAKEDPTLRVYLHYDFLCYIPSRPEVPYLIRCKGLAAQAAKIFIRSAFIACSSAKRPPYMSTFSLGVSTVTYMNNENAIFDFKALNKKPADEDIIASYRWYKNFKDKGVVMQEDDAVEVQTSLKLGDDAKNSDIIF